MRISLLVLLFAVLIFVVSLGFLYIQTRGYIRQDAMQRAEKVLNNTIMEVMKGVIKVVLALIALGTGTELGKRGLNDLNSKTK